MTRIEYAEDELAKSKIAEKASEAIRALLERKKGPAAAAIDGMSGSGKTSLAKELAERFSCRVFYMDDYFLQPFQRTKERFEEPGGNVDYERFKREILEHLSDRKGLSYQIYNCKKQMLGERIFAPWNRLTIVEGSYSCHPYFGDCYDLRIFLETEPGEQIRRIEARNGKEMAKRFASEWIPLENTYFHACKIREKSSLVLTN